MLGMLVMLSIANPLMITPVVIAKTPSSTTIQKIAIAVPENVPTPENGLNIWESWTSPYTRLFGNYPQVFFMMIMFTVLGGLYIKTHNVGGVLAGTIIMSVFLSGLVGGGFSWAFRIVAGVSFVFLLWHIFHVRSE